jgi:hypothetical protein
VNNNSQRKVLAVFVFLTLSGFVSGQSAKLAPLEVKRSTLIEQIKVLKAANPKITPKEWAAAANGLLDTNGLSFAVLLDTSTCDRIRKVKAEQKDPNAPIRLGVSLKSVDAEGASLALPTPTVAAPECGGCYVELPLLQITDSDFITLILGRNIRFHLPPNFLANDVSLLDPKDQSSVIKKWRVPFRSVPIGISHDANVLYLGFEDIELSDLSLLVFGEGVFQIGTRAEAEEGGKGKIEAAEMKDDLRQRITFNRWNNLYLLSYQTACLR